VQDWSSATDAERKAIFDAADRLQLALLGQLSPPPDGWNLGFNIGLAGGQSVPHLQLHLIPRFLGDVPDPSGGVRNIISGRTIAGRSTLASSSAPHGGSLIRGSGKIGGDANDPLLPHLLAHLADACQADIAVAFTLASGVSLLEEYLRDILRRDGQVRLLTGDYMGVTEPDALLRLLDLGPRLDLRVFESGNTSFHLKSYVCVNPVGEGVAFVGSSNLSQTALKHGVEWNWRIVTSKDAPGFIEVRNAFERLIADPRCVRVDAGWISKYRARRPTLAPVEFTAAPELPLDIPRPHEVQEEALSALSATRAAGNSAGLAVLATGLGKTWLAAFDSQLAGDGRVLFVAHRDEILDQAIRTFRRIRPHAVLGKYTGTEKSVDADVVFASVQTLARQKHLDRFAIDSFAYVVIDEFHHAAASTYRRLLDHFTPQFLLGLTATPERTDGADLLALCGDNLVYRCDLVEGIRRRLLAPFDYYGVPDDVDYENIPWRNGKFDEAELTNRLAVTSRANNALQQFRRRGGTRALAFCVSQRHADFMSAHFEAAGIRSVAVHSGTSSAPRAESIRRLKDGELDVLFAVDIFNEGVDLPDIDTVLMLRPTESQVLFLQQLGRGLRLKEGKRLKVVDYIGNHRSFLIKPRTLFQIADSGYAELSAALRLSDDELAGTYLAPGCSVTYDLEAKRFLQDLVLSRVESSDRLEAYYKDFRDRVGTRPSASEAFHDGYDPKSSRHGYGSWFQFVAKMGDIRPTEATAEVELRALLQAIEVTPIRGVEALLILVAMIGEGSFPGRISIEQLIPRVRRIARRSAALREELGSGLEVDDELAARLSSAAKTWSKDEIAARYFSFADGNFVATSAVPVGLKNEAAGLLSEIVEWRLTNYMTRLKRASGVDRIVCRVSHANGKPMLFLPDRTKVFGQPEGWVDITADGRQYQANFVKVAVNVVHEVGIEANLLPVLLRHWYGDDAGLPGTTHRAVFERSAIGYTLKPLDAATMQLDGPRLWSKYARAEGASRLGAAISGFESQSGIVERPGMLLLFVTLDKSGKPDTQQYEDAFLDSTLFRWQSQNRNRRESRIGETIQQLSLPRSIVHLFARETAKVKNITEKFTYCGPLSFERWEGDKPITVWWRLSEEVPHHIREYMRVPGD